MCDRDHLAEWGRKGVNRRQFTKLGALATLAACTAPDDAEAQQRQLSENYAKIDVPAGKVDAFFVYPVQGKHPAIVVWPDIAGLRDAFMSMARRLARQGYAVLVLNPYFQDAEAPQFDDFDDWRTKGGMDKVAPWREKLTAQVVMDTGKSVVTWLDRQDQVDTAKGIGVQGYCMGGPFSVWTAAAAPERVKAAVTFHGAALVGPEDTSPVKMIARSQASFLFAIARNDDRTAPGDKDALKTAAAEAGRPATIEVFRADHGWMVDDSPAFDVDAADRAWDKMLTLYTTAL